MNDINQECYQKSIDLLKKNSTKHGILASSKSSKARNRAYLNVFGRDASICSLGMAVSGDKKLIATAKRSLETLAKYQADNGQIAFYVKPEKKYADFYYLGCIDSTLWWLIAIKFFDKNTNYNLEKKFQVKIKKALNWLTCQEHPNFHLIQQNGASDWADLMPRSGFVLYSNSLWYWVKRLYNIKNADKTKEYFNYVFDPNYKISPAIFKKDTRLKKLLSHIPKHPGNPMYVSFVNYTFYGDEGDIFANVLASIVGLAEEKKVTQIINFLKKKKANQPFPGKTVLKPITRKDKLWTPRMAHLNLNKPYQYHNGGIWPYIGGFWLMLLSINNDKKTINKKRRIKKTKKKSMDNWRDFDFCNGF